MAEAADTIRQDIESTRHKLEMELDRLTTRVRESVDIRHQVREHPWAAIGAAVAAGLVLGGLAGSAAEEGGHARVGTGARSNGGVLAQLGEELEVLKDAAVLTLIDFVHATLREQVPTLGRYLDEVARGRRGALGTRDAAEGEPGDFDLNPAGNAPAA